MSGWWAEAACRSARRPDLWYDPTTVEQAKAVCRRCPVRVECLREAVEHGEERGVWGGLTPDERASRRVPIWERERSLVLSEVERGVSTVPDLMWRTGIDATTTRRHLYALEREGLVTVVREATRRLRVTANVAVS